MDQTRLPGRRTAQWKRDGFRQAPLSSPDLFHPPRQRSPCRMEAVEALTASLNFKGGKSSGMRPRPLCSDASRRIASQRTRVLFCAARLLRERAARDVGLKCGNTNLGALLQDPFHLFALGQPKVKRQPDKRFGIH